MVMDATERERLAEWGIVHESQADVDDLVAGVRTLLAEVERLTALVHAKESWIDGAKVDLDGLTEERNEARAALAEAEARWDEFVSEGHIEDGNRAGFCLCGAEWICPAWTENLSRDWQIESLTAERDRYRRQVEAVRALHRSSQLGAICVECDEAWPCPTVRATEGADGDVPMSPNKSRDPLLTIETIEGRFNPDAPRPPVDDPRPAWLSAANPEETP